MTEALKPEPPAPSDAALISAVRHGDNRAYGLLYQRHLGAARRAAGFLSARPPEREDLVAEAFTRVLQTLRSGRGPNEEFRPYLLVTMRHLAINAARRAPTTALFADVPDAFIRPNSEDPIATRMHSSDAVNAFAGLPERWRMVLWHTEVEGESPAEIAPLLGLTPNGVAALAYRAREGLRQAYLRAQLPAIDQRDCRAAADKLVGWVRRSISGPQRRKISAHLETCQRCRALADGLEQVNGELRAVVAPVVLGTALATGYVKTATAVSWLSAVKASITAGTAQAAAATAIAAATAVTVVASGPTPGTTDGAGSGVAAVQPTIPAADQPEIPAWNVVTAPRHSDPPPHPTSPTTDPPAPPTDQPATPTTPSAKAEKKATKQEAKATEKAAKQSEKAAAKAEKKAAKEEKKPPK